MNYIMRTKSLAFMFIAILVILNLEYTFSLKNLSRKTQLNSKTKVIVQTLNGDSLYYNLPSSKTIENLKQKISIVTGIDVNNQRIIFNGEEVQGKTFKDLNIEPRSVVNLILKVSEN